jgi:hypothetical protein
MVRKCIGKKTAPLVAGPFFVIICRISINDVLTRLYLLVHPEE